MLNVEELVNKVLKEKKKNEMKRQEILKNGCPHTNKTERIATISKIHFLECNICFKQFDLKGNPSKVEYKQIVKELNGDVQGYKII